MNFDIEQKGRAPRRRWLCCMYGLMLAEVHQAYREPREVGDGVEEEFGLALGVGEDKRGVDV